MTFIAINLTLIEFTVLSLAVITFGVTLYFFIKSRKTLQETLRATKKTAFVKTKKEKQNSVKHNKVTELREQFSRLRNEPVLPKQEREELPSKKLIQKEELAVQDLKNTIAQQQRMLDSYLQKVEELENEGREELNSKIELYMNSLNKIEKNKDVVKSFQLGSLLNYDGSTLLHVCGINS